jgi:hypothetical protein
LAPSGELGKKYEGLQGDAVLDHLVEEGEFFTLEAMWSLADSPLAQRVAPRMSRSNQPHLADLLAKEVMNPQLDETVPIPLLNGIGANWPAMSSDMQQTFAQRLLDEAELTGPYETHRDFIEMWMVRQPDAGADFTLEVLTRNTPKSDVDRVMNSAYTRARGNPDLARRASERLLEELVQNPSSENWANAVAFLDRVVAEDAVRAREASALIEEVTRTAAELCAGAPPPTTAALIATQGAETLKKILGGESLPVCPGATLLIQAIEETRRRDARAKLFVDALVHQSNLWADLASPLGGLDEEEWNRRLRELLKLPNRTPIPNLQDLLERVPAHALPRALPAVVEAAVKLGPEDDEGVLQAASQAINQYRLLDPSGTELPLDQLGASLWWPRRKKDEEELQARLRKVLSGALDPAGIAELIAHAVVQGHLSVALAGWLVPSGQEEVSLRSAVPGTIRTELVRELAGYEKDSESLSAAVLTLQAEDFNIDLAEGIAEQAPGIAFSGAETKFADLAEADKDKLVELLEKHGDRTNLDLLDAIARDTLRENRKRRARAAKRIGQILGPGEALPPSVTGLLQSARSDLRTVGAEIIADIKPRDIELCRELRDITGSGSAAKRAQDAREALAASYAEALSESPAKEERMLLLELLGGAAVKASVDPLLAHVGGDALDDDPVVRRQAAKALEETSTFVTLSEAQLAALVQAVEGDDAEADEDAREALQAALARALLGEDAALQHLYDLIGFKPKAEPDRLFGDEKPTIIRHLGLYATAKERGEKGYPEQISQLDIVAERVLRAAYLRLGDSEPIKTQIRAGGTAPDHGALIQATSSIQKLHGARNNLGVLHQLRSEKTEITHPGAPPDESDVRRAESSFQDASKILVGALDEALSGP